jgi:hypothetical protein
MYFKKEIVPIEKQTKVVKKLIKNVLSKNVKAKKKVKKLIKKVKKARKTDAKKPLVNRKLKLGKTKKAGKAKKWITL